MKNRTTPATILAGLALTLTLLAMLPATGLASNMSFDYEPLGMTWGGPYGNSPGDLAMVEDNISMYLAEFHLGAYTGFNTARIEPALVDFGNNQILLLGNICGVFDFSGAPESPHHAQFDFADFGGDENLQVNGSTYYEVASLTSLDGVVVAPGVTCHVNWWSIGGGTAGHVYLEGPVERIVVGGQEFFVDNIRMIAEQNECDILVSHDYQPLGQTWGTAWGNAPGDIAFIEAGVPVLLDIFDHYGTPFFNMAQIDPVFGGFGNYQCIELNNICAVYDIAALGVSVSAVTFEFVDMGGTENIQVNNGPLHIGELLAAPFNIAPGVTFSATPMGSYYLVTLTGDVQRLRLGGQEFWVDEVCIYLGEPLECDRLITFASQPMGMVYGAPVGTTPGSIVFMEDGIPVGMDYMTYFSGATGYNYAEIVPTPTDCLEDEVMQLNNIAAFFDIGAMDVPIQAVIFDYLDFGGEENLRVNGGPLYIGDLHNAPYNIAPGITCQVNVLSTSHGICARVTLLGDVRYLLVAGQEFFLDNVCVILGVETDVDEQSALPARLRMTQNHPNPFNPSTTLNFSLVEDARVQLSIIDVGGRRVSLLLNENRAAGKHEVVWNGTDDAGRSLPSGVYFAQVEAGGEQSVRKITLAK